MKGREVLPSLGETGGEGEPSGVVLILLPWRCAEAWGGPSDGSAFGCQVLRVSCLPFVKLLS